MLTQRFTGKLSGQTIEIPNVNAGPMPALAEPGVVKDGRAVPGFEGLGVTRNYPDVRSYRRKFGLVIPGTNTSTEHELWRIVASNPSLDGIGFHTANVVTPTPKLETAKDLIEYKRQFLDGLEQAVDRSLLAQPEYLILGMSMEHVIAGAEGVRASIAPAVDRSGLAWATCHDAMESALREYGAKRIGLLTPFDKIGNENAARLYEDLGFEVVTSVGFSCANALHIAHLPDWAKEKAILELLATDDHRLDAVVQCGTNMSMAAVSERIEPVVGIPVLGINATLLWYALRENGFGAPLTGAGRLMREF